MDSIPKRNYSFVHRERRVNQKNIAVSLFNQYCIDFDNSKPINCANYFKESMPLTLEIGFGTGDSLFAQAQSNTNQAYVGIEVYKTGIKKLLYRLDQTPLNNIKVIEGDAVDVLSDCILAHTLDNIQILFPDPWPKRRHHKRRLIQPSFIDLLYRALKPGGVLYLATDWEDYAYYMLTILEDSNFTNMTGPLQFADRPTLFPCTKFERRAQTLEHSTFYLVFNKCP